MINHRADKSHERQSVNSNEELYDRREPYSTGLELKTWDSNTEQSWRQVG